jgi:SsrA-binding protein
VVRDKIVSQMSESKIITVNRKAYHDYAIEESLEAGIVLKGTEIKSVRDGKVNIREAYARPENGELWLFNSHIAHYKAGNIYNHEPDRKRKLLLHRKEINYIAAQVVRKGLTLIPLKVYIKGGVAKVELGVARGKKMYDKKESIARRESAREIERSFKQKVR